MCYVRTKSDVILAVVRKKDLLRCDDDAGLRNLKTAACPVRIQVMPGGVVYQANELQPPNGSSYLCFEVVVRLKGNLNSDDTICDACGDGAEISQRLGHINHMS